MSFKLSSDRAVVNGVSACERVLKGHHSVCLPSWTDKVNEGASLPLTSPPSEHMKEECFVPCAIKATLCDSSLTNNGNFLTDSELMDAMLSAIACT